MGGPGLLGVSRGTTWDGRPKESELRAMRELSLPMRGARLPPPGSKGPEPTPPQLPWGQRKPANTEGLDDRRIPSFQQIITHQSKNREDLQMKLKRDDQ